ncbi:MAG: hypothetical protein BJ554DRAFT_2210 [Olpidium bornovanus]|uniref:Uncharacterized protein n=1 Tax=Olpidium bornovanus TaxID=278681 RepID=A0A8H7ZQD5_9FUNG|nr:MAG: hypothetical protein BJ554DRAFT_2210 [Olpidium bornovanus]
MLRRLPPPVRALAEETAVALRDPDLPPALLGVALALAACLGLLCLRRALRPAPPSLAIPPPLPSPVTAPRRRSSPDFFWPAPRASTPGGPSEVTPLVRSDAVSASSPSPSSSSSSSSSLASASASPPAAAAAAARNGSPGGEGKRGRGGEAGADGGRGGAGGGGGGGGERGGERGGRGVALSSYRTSYDPLGSFWSTTSSVGVNVNTCESHRCDGPDWREVLDRRERERSTRAELLLRYAREQASPAAAPSPPTT